MNKQVGALGLVAAVLAGPAAAVSSAASPGVTLDLALITTNLGGVTTSIANQDQVLTTTPLTFSDTTYPALETTPAKPGVAGLVEMVTYTQSYTYDYLAWSDSTSLTVSNTNASIGGSQYLVVNGSISVAPDSHFLYPALSISLTGAFAPQTVSIPGVPPSGVSMPGTPVLMLLTPGGSYSQLAATTNVDAVGSTYQTGAFASFGGATSFSLAVAVGAGLSIDTLTLSYSYNDWGAGPSTPLGKPVRNVLSTTVLPPLAVPEADAVLLALAGAGVVGAVARRRRRDAGRVDH